jgi:hypothetical protein
LNNAASTPGSREMPSARKLTSKSGLRIRLSISINSRGFEGNKTAVASSSSSALSGYFFSAFCMAAEFGSGFAEGYGHHRQKMPQL